MQYPVIATQHHVPTSSLDASWIQGAEYRLPGTGHWFSENRIVVKPYSTARTLLGRIHDAGIKRSRVDVQGYSPLVRLPRIDHAVHRLLRIDRAWIGYCQLNGVRCEQTALPHLNILKF